MTNKNLASAIIDRAPIANVTVDMTEGQLVRVPKKELEDLLASMNPITYTFTIDLKEEETMKTTNPVAEEKPAEEVKKERKPRQKLGFTPSIYAAFTETAEALACTVSEYRNTLFAKNGKHRAYKLCYVRKGYNLFPKPEILEDVERVLVAEGISFEKGKNVKYDLQDWFTLSEEGVLLALKAMAR